MRMCVRARLGSQARRRGEGRGARGAGGHLEWRWVWRSSILVVGETRRGMRLAGAMREEVSTPGVLGGGERRPQETGARSAFAGLGVLENNVICG